MSRQIAIVGSSFDARLAAREIAEATRRRSHLEVTAVTGAAHAPYTPLLPHVVTDTIPPEHLALSHTSRLPDAWTVHTGRVEDLDLDARTMKVDGERVDFDYLLLAPRVRPRPAPESRIGSLETLHRAVDLRELAAGRSTRPAPERVEILGATPRGVELAVELATHRGASDRDRPPPEIRVAETRPAWDPDVPKPVRGPLRRRLRALGIEFELDADVSPSSRADGDEDVETIDCRRGVLPGAARACDLADPQTGRLPVDRHLASPEVDQVFAAGGAVELADEGAEPARSVRRRPGRPGRLAAANLLADLEGRILQSWDDTSTDWAFSAGGGRAIVDWNGVSLEGRVGGLAYGLLHASRLPTPGASAALAGAWLDLRGGLDSVGAHFDELLTRS